MLQRSAAVKDRDSLGFFSSVDSALEACDISAFSRYFSKRILQPFRNLRRELYHQLHLSF